MTESYLLAGLALKSEPTESLNFGYLFQSMYNNSNVTCYIL